MALRIIGTKGDVQAPKATSHPDRSNMRTVSYCPSLFEWTCLDGLT